MNREAFINVDIQNDFCPGGSLAVSHGDHVVDPANRLNRLARETGQLIVASRDWHPAKTTHFLSGGGIWPTHCIQNTKGAQFHPDLNLEGAVVVSKGMGETEDSYSAFEARDKEGVLLAEILRGIGVDTVNVFGLATDYCVKASAFSSVQEGFITRFVEDASRAVNINYSDGRKAINEMEKVGVEIVSVNDLLARASTSGIIEAYLTPEQRNDYYPQPINFKRKITIEEIEAAKKWWEEELEKGRKLRDLD